MLFENGFTLEQLLKVYNKEELINKIPESLRDERLSTYGLSFIAAVNAKEAWIDTAISTYLGSEEFFSDLEKADEEWKNRCLENNDYWLELACAKGRRIYLTVDMDLKDF